MTTLDDSALLEQMKAPSDEFGRLAAAIGAQLKSDEQSLKRGHVNFSTTYLEKQGGSLYQAIVECWTHFRQTNATCASMHSPLEGPIVDVSANPYYRELEAYFQQWIQQEATHPWSLTALCFWNPLGQELVVIYYNRGSMTTWPLNRFITFSIECHGNTGAFHTLVQSAVSFLQTFRQIPSDSILLNVDLITQY